MLEQVRGNDAIKQDLQAALVAGRLCHSILLCGEAGTGTGFVARCLAADYLYPAGGPAAAAVMSGESPEVLTLAPEGAGAEIRIERVRAVRQEIFNTALSAQGRVVLVHGAHRLNASSANALLKVLEEPPEGVLFVLTAPGAASVLPTLRSRSCAYALAPVSEAACTAYLEEHFPEEKDCASFAVIFGGKIGSAVRCLRDPIRRRTLDDAKALLHTAQQHNTYGALCILSGYEKDRQETRALLDTARQVSAAIVRGRAQGSAPLAAAALDALAEADARLAANGNTKLTLTVLADALCA